MNIRYSASLMFMSISFSAFMNFGVCEWIKLMSPDSPANSKFSAAADILSAPMLAEALFKA